MQDTERNYMRSEQIDKKQKVITEAELNKAILEAQESGAVTARMEIGEWIESNMIDGPTDNPYTTFFSVMAKRLKQGKRL
jgi:hypothetical protein